jgi:hypothetical protein
MSFLIHESADEYRAKAKHYLSSHQLADFRKCPQLYYRKTPARRKSRLQTLWFSGESMWFFSGGPGFELGKFEL